MEEGFLQALAAQPRDDVARLVYADWLQERDDPRAEFLRLEVRLAANDFPPGERGELVTRLAELSRVAEPGWLQAVNRTPFVSCRVHARGQGQARSATRPGAKVELANYATCSMLIAFDVDPMQYLHATITDPIGRVWEGCYERVFEEERARTGQLRLSLGERYSAHVPLLEVIPRSERMLGRYTIEAAYNYDEVLSQAEPITFEVTEEDRNWWKRNPNG